MFLRCKGTNKSRHVQIFKQKNDKKIHFLSKNVIFIWLFEKKAVILHDFKITRAIWKTKKKKKKDRTTEDRY